MSRQEAKGGALLTIGWIRHVNEQDPEGQDEEAL